MPRIATEMIVRLGLTNGFFVWADFGISTNALAVMFYWPEF